MGSQRQAEKFGNFGKCEVWDELGLGCDLNSLCVLVKYIDDDWRG